MQDETAAIAREQICLTFDVDWAEEEVLLDVVKRLHKANVKATFFATHNSSALKSLDNAQFEVGLHPHFRNLEAGLDAPVKELKSLYPNAVGARSHGLFVSSSALNAYRGCGLRYESNIFLLLHEGLHTVRRFRDMVSIPFYWSDDKHLELEWGFDLSMLRLDQQGLKVLNFHPIHVFLNSPDVALYEKSKTDFQNVDWLRGLQNTSSRGIGTLFDDLLRHLAAKGLRTWKMHEMQELFDEHDAA